MSLSGLLAAAVADPALAAVAESIGAADARRSAARPALQPFAIAAAARAGPARCSPSPARGREAEDLVAALRCLLPPDEVALYPGWETLPHERLSPRADTVGQRLAVLRRLAHPSTDDPAAGPLSVVVAPVRAVLQPQVPRPRRARPGRAARRRRRPRAHRHRHRPRRRRVRAHRTRREARRLRRARRHPRRLPADRGAPAAGGVLGRRGRGDPLLQGRRPALARGRRARAVGAAVPRAAAHRRTCRRGPASCSPSTPSSASCSTRSAAARPSRAWRRSRRSSSTSCASCCTSCRPARTSWSATPSGCAPARPTSSARRRSSSTRRGRSPPAAAGAGRPRRGLAARPRRRRGGRARARPAVVGDHAR